MVRKLGIMGLGVDANFILQQFTNHKNDIQTVSFNVLMRWRQQFTGDKQAAFTTLCEALEKVGMSRQSRALKNLDV